MARTPEVKARITSEELKTRLESWTLTPAEERAVRMLHGLGVRPDAPLARMAGEGTELAEELLLLELQLHKQMQRRSAGRSTTKSKIVRALRKKKG